MELRFFRSLLPLKAHRYGEIFRVLDAFFICHIGVGFFKIRTFFLDKFLGLGYFWYNEVQFGTDPEKSYLAGGSPTFGFLNFGTEGKFLQDVFQPLAGNAIVDFLFLFGLFGVGIALMTGAGRRLGGGGGAHPDGGDGHLRPGDGAGSW